MHFGVWLLGKKYSSAIVIDAKSKNKQDLQFYFFCYCRQYNKLLKF